MTTNKPALWRFDSSDVRTNTYVITNGLETHTVKLLGQYTPSELTAVARTTCNLRNIAGLVTATTKLEAENLRLNSALAKALDSLQENEVFMAQTILEEALKERLNQEKSHHEH